MCPLKYFITHRLVLISSCLFIYKSDLPCPQLQSRTLNSGRSMALSACGVAASTDTYSCVSGRSVRSAAGNCALVTYGDTTQGCYNVRLM